MQANLLLSIKNVATPLVKSGMSKQLMKLSIQRLHSSDAQNVKPPEENPDDSNPQLY